MPRPVGILSLGVLILVLAVSATAFAAKILVHVSEIFSLTFILFGFWFIVLAGIQAANPEHYGGVFNIFSGGILIITLGTVWFLYARKLLVEYLLPALLLVTGILVAVVGIRTWRK